MSVLGGIRRHEIRGQDMGSVKNRTEIIGVKAPKISNLQKKIQKICEFFKHIKIV